MLRDLIVGAALPSSSPKLGSTFELLVVCLSGVAWSKLGNAEELVIVITAWSLTG